MNEIILEEIDFTGMFWPRILLTISRQLVSSKS